MPRKFHLFTDLDGRCFLKDSASSGTLEFPTLIEALAYTNQLCPANEAQVTAISAFGSVELPKSPLPLDFFL
jgi:hypothetical protein